MKKKGKKFLELQEKYNLYIKTLQNKLRKLPDVLQCNFPIEPCIKQSYICLVEYIVYPGVERKTTRIVILCL